MEACHYSSSLRVDLRTLRLVVYRQGELLVGNWFQLQSMVVFIFMLLQCKVVILQDHNCLISLGNGSAWSQARERWGQVCACA